MAVKPPPRRKPSSADEVARVLRIYEVLADEMRKRSPTMAMTRMAGDSILRVLDVAERIAARTED